jgi:hypothetical protein
VLDWPIPPEVSDAQRTEGKVWLRYEDVCQDGRLVVAGMPHALGEIFWRRMGEASGVGEPIRAHGIVPILSKLVTVGDAGPLSIRNPLTGRGRYQLACCRDDAGDVEQIVLNVWVSLEGERDRTHGPKPEGAGEVIQAGRVFAEHVFTRPFAPAGQRRVTRLVAPLPEVPDAVTRHQPPVAMLQLPPGATPIDEALVWDDTPIVVGLDHTDSNQHVNSLEYPRWFRAAALRRALAVARDSERLVRYQACAFRKPCFAGQQMRIALRCFDMHGATGAVLALLEQGASLEMARTGKAHCYGVVLFD